MPRKRSLLALSIPLALIACVLGHAAGYAVAGANPRDQALHGYLGYGPLFVAACATFAAFALALRVAGRLQGRPSPVPLLLIGPLAFLTQELVERLAAGLPASALLAPPVLAGLLAQLPLALASYSLGRWLLRAADTLAALLMTAPDGLSAAALLSAPAVQPRPLRPSHTHTGFGRAPPTYRAL
jgi:hypothetical protein